MTEYNLNNIVSDISEVPDSWIYKHYYRKITGNTIGQPFDGRIIKVKSVVNSDSNPSLCFFYKNNKYLWKDFSSGTGGDSIKFIAHHMSKTLSSAIIMITTDFEKFLMAEENYEEPEINTKLFEKPNYKIIFDYHTPRTLEFWQYFKINLELLNLYKVKKGSHYTITKGEKEYTFGGMVFIYMTSKGPYQIYQPFDANCKYMNIDTKYLIGSEQLEFKKNVCIIQSGLKDIMACRATGINAEFVAPTSENCLISKETIEFLQSKYEYVLTMFDNDKAGVKAMLRYKKIYNLPYVHIKLKKDAAENNTYYDLKYLNSHYSEQINEKINVYERT